MKEVKRTQKVNGKGSYILNTCSASRLCDMYIVFRNTHKQDESHLYLEEIECWSLSTI
jgi:hypothetical protein